MAKNKKNKKRNKLDFYNRGEEAQRLSSSQFRIQVIPDKRHKDPKYKHKAIEGE